MSGGFWQLIDYERMPRFCTTCRSRGHLAAGCSLAPNPEGNPDPSQPSTVGLSPLPSVLQVHVPLVGTPCPSSGNCSTHADLLPKILVPSLPFAVTALVSVI